MNKRKIINDPVYGFVYIPFEIIFDLIEHPVFQRLRRIQQLGLTNFVYPGALHTRFNHALGALHLTIQAIEVLRSKGHQITDAEAKATCIAILLHDIGHGPFSHTLEKCLINASHEEISLVIMEKLDREMKGKLQMAISIYKNEYRKKFLCQLVSGQLDMDRLDYLNRDSFFTGVYEGVIGYDRIIKMLEVKDGNLVIEAKGIYSIEKFIIARRLMYWQVYLHKTVIAAEQMLLKIFMRAKELGMDKISPGISRNLVALLSENTGINELADNEVKLQQFIELDDLDLFHAIKTWKDNDDGVLSVLCNRLINRNLLKCDLHNQPVNKEVYEDLLGKTMKYYSLDREKARYLTFMDSTSNYAYNHKLQSIKVLYKDGTTLDVTEASDQLNISVLSQPVVKYYLCYPKEIIE